MTGVSSAEATKTEGGWSTCPVKRGWPSRGFPEKRSLWGTEKTRVFLEAVYPRGHFWEKSQAIYTEVHAGITRYDGFNLKQIKFRLEERKIIFTVKATKQWSRLPKEAVQSSSWGVFKTQMDKVLSNLVWSHNWPCLEQRGWTKDLLRSFPLWIVLWDSDSQIVFVGLGWFVPLTLNSKFTQDQMVLHALRPST